MMKQPIPPILNALLEMPRALKRLISLGLDAFMLVFAYIGAKTLRVGYLDTPDNKEEWLAVSITVLASVFIFARTGLYRAILRHLAPQAMTAVFIGVASSTLTLVTLNFFLNVDSPRTVPIIYGLIALALIGGSRYTVRMFVASLSKDNKLRVVIYGAGDAGSQLALALMHGREYSPVLFVDDNKELWGSVIQGLSVYPPSELNRIISESAINKVLLALPSVSNQRRREILLSLEKLPVRVQTMAGIADLVAGVNVEQVRDIDVQDLLGRDSVAPKEELLLQCIKDKSVLVTGAGGSIGSELCRQIIANTPNTLILVEHSEFALYSITNELQTYCKLHSKNIRVLPILTSVQNRKSLLTIMKLFSVQTVYHAAAYKHVPLVEYNVIEGIQNNVFGTWHTASAAMEAGVDSFVLISTDPESNVQDSI